MNHDNKLRRKLNKKSPFQVSARPPFRPPTCPIPELSRVGQDFVGRNVRAAQVGDQDLRLLGVSLLNVLEGFLAGDGGAAVASQRTPVGQRLQEPRDVLEAALFVFIGFRGEQ
jgi:hypothetical protein